MSCDIIQVTSVDESVLVTVEEPTNSIILEEVSLAISIEDIVINVTSQEETLSIVSEDEVLQIIYTEETLNIIIDEVFEQTAIEGDSVPRATRVDFINDGLLYRGEAAPGTANATALWRIRRITIAGDDDITEEWADGVDTFNKVWDDRLSLLYS